MKEEEMGVLWKGWWLKGGAVMAWEKRVKRDTMSHSDTVSVTQAERFR
jgi:hypothetical protein